MTSRPHAVPPWALGPRHERTAEGHQGTVVPHAGSKPFPPSPNPSYPPAAQPRMANEETAASNTGGGGAKDTGATGTGLIVISPALGNGRTLRITFPDWRPSSDAKLGVLIFTARALDVPEVCIALTWHSRAAATYVIGAHDTGVDWIEAHDQSDLTCDACGDPCDDADLCPDQGPTGTARDCNCARCQPWSLCERCSVNIGPVQVCLNCLTDEEAKGLTWPKHRRRILLGDLCTLRDARSPRGRAPTAAGAQYGGVA
jgi:hypothetical protein